MSVAPTNQNPVLKLGHSLVGKSILPMIMEFKDLKEEIRIEDLARFDQSKPLNTYNLDDLSTGFFKLTGENLMKILTLTGKSENLEWARQLVHKAILKANEVGGPDPKGEDEKNHEFASTKTVAKGLLDISLLMANASQLRSVLSAGINSENFWPAVILILLSVALQLCVGIVLLILGSKEAIQTTKEDRTSIRRLTNTSVALIVLITVVNIFIAVFGVTTSI